MTPIAAYRSEIWDLEEPARELIIDHWLDCAQRRFKIADGFRESGARRWVRELIDYWDLHSLSVVEMTAITGLDKGTISRFRNHYCVSRGVIALLAARFQKPLTPLAQAQFALSGASFVLPLCEWLEVTEKSKPQKTAIDDSLNLNSTCLVLALFGAALHERWHRITVRYEHDLSQGLNDPNVRAFVLTFAVAYQFVAREIPELRKQQECYFPGNKITPESTWLVFRDLNTLWSRFHFYGICVMRSIEGLSPLLDNLPQPR